MSKSIRKYVFFGMYLCLMIYELLASSWRVAGKISSYNLEFFSTINRYFSNTSLLLSRLFWINIIGNIVFFVPLGFFLPVCFNRFEKWQRMIPFCILLICAMEGLQYILGVGVFDIDDIFLNMIGVILGYLLAFFFIRVQRKKG